MSGVSAPPGLHPPRMGEYVRALRAIWRCWENGSTPAYQPCPAQFRGRTLQLHADDSGILTAADWSTDGTDHNRRSRSGHAATGGRHCDGVRLHAFCTRAYAEQVVVPEIEKGLSQSGRKRENFEVTGGGFIVTGSDEAGLAKGRERVRPDIGFYGQSQNCMDSATSRRSSISWCAPKQRRKGSTRVGSLLRGRRHKMRYASLRRAKRSLTSRLRWESGAEASTARLKARVKPIKLELSLQRRGGALWLAYLRFTACAGLATTAGVFVACAEFVRSGD